MIKSVLPYLGSKSVSLGCVLPHIVTDTDVFIEPFCGSCAVTLGLLQSRPKQFKHMICSDLNEDVILYWELVKRYGSKLSYIISNTVATYLTPVLNGEFNTVPVVEDKTARGALFYIKCACSHRRRVSDGLNVGKVAILQYGLSEIEGKRLDLCQELLQDVEFKHADYIDALHYARSYSDSVSVFCDPPYPVVKGYPQNYENDEIDMSILLKNLESFPNVVISYSVNDFVRESAINMGYTASVADLRLYSIASRHELYLYK